MAGLSTAVLIPSRCPACLCEYFTPASLQLGDGHLLYRNVPPQGREPPPYERPFPEGYEEPAEEPPRQARSQTPPAVRRQRWKEARRAEREAEEQRVKEEQEALRAEREAEVQRFKDELPSESVSEAEFEPDWGGAPGKANDIAGDAALPERDGKQAADSAAEDDKHFAAAVPEHDGKVAADSAAEDNRVFAANIPKEDEKKKSAGSAAPPSDDGKGTASASVPRDDRKSDAASAFDQMEGASSSARPQAKARLRSPSCPPREQPKPKYEAKKRPSSAPPPPGKKNRRSDEFEETRPRFKYEDFEYDEKYYEQRQTMSQKEARTKWKNRVRAWLHQRGMLDDYDD